MAYEHVFGAERLAAIDAGAREERWQRRLAAPERHEATLVADDDGSVVGFASCGENRDVAGEGELYAIYALPETWGSGVGAALMAGVFGALRASGFPTAVLWVLEDNPRARRFYEREGWRLDGGRRDEEILGVRITEVRYRVTLD